MSKKKVSLRPVVDAIEHLLKELEEAADPTDAKALGEWAERSQATFMISTPTFALSRSMVAMRSRIMPTPTLAPPLTETTAFSVVRPSGLK